MKRTVSLIGILLVFTFCGAVFSGFAMGDEFRVWKDLKGRTLNARLVKIDGDEVVLEFQGGREARVERSKLSPEDNRFLDEYAKPIKKQQYSLLPEKDVDLDTKTFKKLAEPFLFPDFPHEFNGIKTEHFLVISDKRARLNDLAETAERLWHGMNVQHPSFSKKWGNWRRLILFLEDSKVKESLGSWAAKTSEANGSSNFANQLRMNWEGSTRWSFYLPVEFANKHRLFRLVDMLKPIKVEARDYLEIFNPVVTNFLSNSLLFHHTGGLRNDEGRGSYAIVEGHSLYKEVVLTKGIHRNFSTAADDADSLVSSASFEDVEKWPTLLKGLIRKDKVEPTLRALYAYHEDDQTVEVIMLAYGFTHYMHSSPARLKSYATLLDKIKASKRVPQLLELAEIFGFKTVEELEKDWVEYLKSREFK